MLSSADSNCAFQIKSRLLLKCKTRGCWTQATESKNVEFWGLFWKERNKDTGKIVLIRFALTSFSVTPEIARSFAYYWLWLSIRRELSLFVTFLNSHNLISANKCRAGSLFGKMSNGKCTLKQRSRYKEFRTLNLTICSLHPSIGRNLVVGSFSSLTIVHWNHQLEARGGEELSYGLESTKGNHSSKPKVTKMDSNAITVLL